MPHSNFGISKTMFKNILSYLFLNLMKSFLDSYNLVINKLASSGVIS